VIAGVVSYMLLCWGGGLCILYITHSKKLSKPDDGRYRPKHVD